MKIAMKPHLDVPSSYLFWRNITSSDLSHLLPSRVPPGFQTTCNFLAAFLNAYSICKVCQGALEKSKLIVCLYVGCAHVHIKKFKGLALMGTGKSIIHRIGWEIKQVMQLR